VTAAIKAVIFDWAGTLTPWVPFEPESEWRALAEALGPPDLEVTVKALADAADVVWARVRSDHSSATFDEICALAGVTPTDAALESYRAHWEPATFTDPDVPELVQGLHERGIRAGVLSNTVWPRAWHEAVFERDGVGDLFDGAVYSSEIAWVKPHPEAFAAAREAVGVADPAACVFVGDRLFEDIYGAQRAGMRAVLVPHSDIPSGQRGPEEGEPDAVVQRLSDVLTVVDGWRAP
jgi:putative hydrolase of the HAD superfamily